MVSYGKKHINIYNKMKKDTLHSLIKEELAKALNEFAAKFQEGDTFLYMGDKHTVTSIQHTVTNFLPSSMPAAGRAVGWH